MVDELRCHPNEWLREERSRVVIEQRRLRVREVAITKVLDERDAREPMPRGVGAREHRQVDGRGRAGVGVDCRRWRTQPSGRLSFEQLEPLTRIATPRPMPSGLARGERLSRFDLQKLARVGRGKLTAEDARRRMEARELRTWREPEIGMCAGRLRLAELGRDPGREGARAHGRADAAPPRASAWAPLAHRKADALVDLCTNYADVERTGRFKFTIVNHVRADGSADCEGLDVPLETIDAIRPNAKVKTRHEDAHGVEPTAPRLAPTCPPRSSGTCANATRTVGSPGATHIRRLQAHHLVPRCRGGWDGIDNLAMVCPYHHRLLVPHGPGTSSVTPNRSTDSGSSTRTSSSTPAPDPAP